MTAYHYDKQPLTQKILQSREGRFKSQALLDEASVMACMAYVDLNPIRSRLANTPESSDHTSIQQRINAAKLNQQPRSLLPFAGNPSGNMPDGLPFRIEDYLAIVEITGRHFHPGKQGKIKDTAAQILTRVGLETTDWQALVTGIETDFTTTVSTEKLSLAQQRIRRRRSA